MMVAGQNDTRAVNEGMSGGCHAFETRDFYLACFLRCAGYDLIDLRGEGRRKIFVFRDRPRRDDALAFYGRRCRRSGLAFSTTIKDMKACCTMHDDSLQVDAVQSGGPQFREALTRLIQVVLRQASSWSFGLVIVNSERLI